MSFFKRSGMWQDVSSPTGAIADFVTVFRNAGTMRWRSAAVAAAATFAVFSVMWREGGRIEPRPPEVTYITTFAGHRTDAQILASNRANQAFQDRLTAEQTRRDEDVKQLYRTIGRATGVDVDAADRQARQAAVADPQAARQAAARRAAAAAQTRAFAALGHDKTAADEDSTGR